MLDPQRPRVLCLQKVFDASAWNARMSRNHRGLNRDLVCPGCAERGYAPGKYDEHQCEECLETFGSLKFDRKSKYKTKRNEKCRWVCKACLTKIQCSSWKTAYELKYWSRSCRTRATTRTSTWPPVWQCPTTCTVKRARCT